MVPPPSATHQRFGSRLLVALSAIARARGFEFAYELGVLDPARDDFSNYRQPDLIIAAPDHISKRGVEGRAELVIEIVSPNDESRDKFDFYAMCKVQEVWLVDPETRAFEVYTLRGGKYFAVAPDRAGLVHAPVLAIDLQLVDGPKLRLTWSGGSEDI